MASSSSSKDPWMQAVQAGDVIRRHSAIWKTKNVPSNSNHPFFLPGALQGVLAATGTALLTWPLRRGLFRLLNKNNSKQFQIFLEFVITPLQVLTVLQVSLFVGSVCGSHSYLQQFLLEQKHQERIIATTGTSESSMVSDVCRELLVGSVSSTTTTTSSSSTHNKNNSSKNSTTRWSPPTQILQTYQQVLQQCQKQQDETA